MRHWLLALAIAVSPGLLTLVVASPAAAGCTTIADDLGEVSQSCEYTDEEIVALRSQAQTSVWEVYQICKDGTSGGAEVCSNPVACELGGVIGTWYVVRRDGVTIGRACLTSDESPKYDTPPIRVLVIKAFENLDWSESALVVQPPGGRTLVNLDTNFYTDNSGFTVIPVTLIQSEVRVQAEPISYTWHFGDGTTETTTSPGALYPDLDVAHVYDSADEVVVRVDTTYGNASFSVAGGPWETIPSTITIPGTESDLAIVEARPQLVIR